jgi:hypothetical protein
MQCLLPLLLLLLLKKAQLRQAVLLLGLQLVHTTGDPGSAAWVLL